MKTFGERLKHLREKKKQENPKWTQEYVADLVGVARTTYTAYERGTKQPQLDTVNKLADLFEVSADYLLGRTDNPNPPETDDIPEELNTLAKINQLIKKYGIEQMGFFDIEKWKSLSEEEIEEIIKHFEWVVHKAKEKNKAASEDTED
ncbi:helix-turn-helix transcriptional regulator [Parageobacillus sp. VR-IP]|uniref:helix-turn-helix domain-containing protein n=1 Tax=Parageobacillus sp. VR-IP TaxID=2742205 RepID=UPI0015841C5B|nr:helix-turn-helix transcriptional regulator [Parageobacillus sp. VR-IP]NUK31013.1 helix-turn-helix transcriptional regulator [Parageobacillus sp. VR-IP]